MTLPNFLIIGAGKAGTTSLYHYLEQHPDIFMCPVKEPRFFIYEQRYADLLADPEVAEYFKYRTLAQYEALFDGVRGEQVVGEASIQYYASVGAAKRIAGTLGSPRMVAILRNPIERAYSSYTMEMVAGRERRSFEQAVEDELNGVNAEHPLGRFHHLERGLYHHHLTAFRARFDQPNLKLYLYEDLKINLPGLLRDLFQFLGVDPSFEPDTTIKYNSSGVPKNAALNKLTGKNALTRFVKTCTPRLLREPLYARAMKWRNRNLESRTMRADVRERLLAYYRQDVEALQALLGRDLSHWLSLSSGTDASDWPPEQFRIAS
ncbi:MAG: sulfotransferase domain-containing protein [Phycisphaeraceae bacterium]